MAVNIEKGHFFIINVNYVSLMVNINKNEEIKVLVLLIECCSVWFYNTNKVI